MKKNANRIAANAILNIVFFPGLGSLRAGRKLAGAGQIILVLTGSVMVMIWFFKEIAQYYGLMFGDAKPQAIGWIGETGAVVFAFAWLWALVTSLSLFREASKSGTMPVERLAAASVPLDEARILAGLMTLPQWQRTEAVIARTYEFKDFTAAVTFVDAVAEAAEEAWHHPDIDIRWNKVTLALTTHDAGGLTEMDLTLAKKYDALSNL